MSLTIWKNFSFTSKVSNKHFKESSTLVSRYRTKMHSPGNWPSPSGTVSSSSSCQRQIEKITSHYKDVILVSLDYQTSIYTFLQAAGNLRHADEACWGRNSCHCPLTRYWLTFVFPFSFDGRDLVLSGLKMPHNSIILAPSLPDYYDKPTYLFYQHTDKKI